MKEDSKLPSATKWNPSVCWVVSQNKLESSDQLLPSKTMQIDAK